MPLSTAEIANTMEAAPRSRDHHRAGRHREEYHDPQGREQDCRKFHRRDQQAQQEENDDLADIGQNVKEIDEIPFL